MRCDIQSLFDDAACFYGLNERDLSVSIAALWCDVAQGLSPSENEAVQSLTDGEWYDLIGIEIGPNDAVLWMDQVATTPAASPYRVIEDPDTLLKYKIQATGAPPDVEWILDETPTGEAATPTVITVGSTQYNLVVRDDGGLRPLLEPI